MTEYQRTQVYLEPDRHLALRRFAADRGVSMATVVREAVAEYLVRHGEGSSEGLVERMHARLAAGPPPGFRSAPPGVAEAELGEYLYQEHLRHIAEWEARQEKRQAVS
ncbi:MAG: CopG family transcriptional regulator [Egibacteraceae bacterium]